MKQRIKDALEEHDAILELALTDAALTATSWRLLWFLKTRYNYKRDLAPWHKIGTIARFLGCNRSTIKRGLSQLAERGYVVRRKRDSKTHPFAYCLNRKLIQNRGGKSAPPSEIRGGADESMGGKFAPPIPSYNKDQDTEVLEARAPVREPRAQTRQKDPGVLEQWEQIRGRFRAFASDKNFAQFFGPDSGLEIVALTDTDLVLYQPDSFLAAYTLDIYGPKIEASAGRGVTIDNFAPACYNSTKALEGGNVVG